MLTEEKFQQFCRAISEFGPDHALVLQDGRMLARHDWVPEVRQNQYSITKSITGTAIGFALFLRGKIPRLGVVAILLAFGGSVVLALSGGVEAGELSGNLLALAAAVASALYTLIGRVQRGHLSTTVYTFLTYLACFVTLVVLTAGTGTPLTGYGVRELFMGLALAVLCTLLGGEFRENLETTASGWFALDELPPLDLEKTTPEQLRMCFDARREHWETLLE